jgi:uncharacterized membrane protein SpoIIM required for sporulation
MNSTDFTRRHESDWLRLQAMIDAALSTRRRPGRRAGASAPGGDAEFPSLYRQLCQQLALARDRRYPPHIIDRLNVLALTGHEALYGSRRGLWRAIRNFALEGFPLLVRRHWRLFWAATALTYLPALAMAYVVWSQPQMVYSLIDPQQVLEFENMYRPGRAHVGFKRDADVNFMMFGHYIQNNISIGFRCFAGGLLFGLGAVAALVFNGLLLGAVAVHLTRLGYAAQFFQFVVGHGAFELTAISLCGMAGLMLGQALIAPGRLTRRDALAQAAHDAVKIVYGAAAMLLIAAFIEAFWSSSRWVPASVKFGTAVLLWTLVAGYFLFMGRRRAH